MKRFLCTTIAMCLAPAAGIHAQDMTLNDIKGKIFDARMAKQTFGNGAKFCNELNGTNFYFALRDRVLNLEEFHHSLDNLVRQQVFNPEKRRPWSEQDATDRWAEVQKEAVKDKANCQLIATLPDLEKQLDDMQKKVGATDKKN